MLIAEVLRTGKHKPVVHDHNFVAKHAKRSGAGVHLDKTGPAASRSRQKKAWKKEIYND